MYSACDDMLHGSLLFLPMEKGAGLFARRGHGWATTAGVLADGKVKQTRDHQGEYMTAALKPDGVDFSRLVPVGYMNDSHRALPVPGARCTGRCTNASPDRACAVHGGKRLSVLTGIPDKVEYVGPDHELAARDAKVGSYIWFHLFDRADPASWRNPDGSERMRMLHGGTVTDEPFAPTPEELDRAEATYADGIRDQRDGRVTGLSIQGRETALPIGDGDKAIVRASAHQVATIRLPHNPDATIEGWGDEMAKGEAPIVVSLAEKLLKEPRTLRLRLAIHNREEAIAKARRFLRETGIYHG